VVKGRLRLVFTALILRKNYSAGMDEISVLTCTYFDLGKIESQNRNKSRMVQVRVGIPVILFILSKNA